MMVNFMSVSMLDIIQDLNLLSVSEFSFSQDILTIVRSLQHYGENWWPTLEIDSKDTLRLT